MYFAPARTQESGVDPTSGAIRFALPRAVSHLEPHRALSPADNRAAMPAELTDHWASCGRQHVDSEWSLRGKAQIFQNPGTETSRAGGTSLAEKVDEPTSDDGSKRFDIHVLELPLQELYPHLLGLDLAVW